MPATSQAVLRISPASARPRPDCWVRLIRTMATILNTTPSGTTPSSPKTSDAIANPLVLSGSTGSTLSARSATPDPRSSNTISPPLSPPPVTAFYGETGASESFLGRLTDRRSD